jgi:hypothetical protein
MSRIKLVIGDWSCDGHEKSDDYYIESNLSKKEIEKAYKKGTKLLGFDFSEEIAECYEDSTLPKDKWEKFKELGYTGGFDSEDQADENGVNIWLEEFLDLYLFIIQLGNPDFKYELVEEEDTIHIGGYGLYH